MIVHIIYTLLCCTALVEASVASLYLNVKYYKKLAANVQVHVYSCKNCICILVHTGYEYMSVHSSKLCMCLWCELHVHVHLQVHVVSMFTKVHRTQLQKALAFDRCCNVSMYMYMYMYIVITMPLS